MKTLNPILPNAGVAAKFRRELNALIDDLFEAYRANLLSEIAGMAADSKPKTPKEAEAAFREKAAKIAADFAKRAGRHTEAGLIQAMKKAGFTQSDLRRLRRDKSAYAAIEQQIISSNVELITNIPAAVEAKIKKMVQRSIDNHSDLGGLIKELDTLKEMTHRRSKFISRDQNNKITNQMSLLKVQSLGITQGVWIHRSGSAVPRKTHLAMHGETFNLSEGLFDEAEGVFVLPGQMYNCGCTYKPVLPDVMQNEPPQGGDTDTEALPPIQTQTQTETETEAAEPNSDNLLNWRDKYEKEPKVIALRETERKQDDIIKNTLKDYQGLLEEIETAGLNDIADRADRAISHIKDNPSGTLGSFYIQDYKDKYGINGLKEIEQLRDKLRIAEKAQGKKAKARGDLSKIIGAVEADPQYVAENKIAARCDGGKLSTEALAELHIGIQRAREQFPELDIMPFTGSIQARQRTIAREIGIRKATKSNVLAYSADGGRFLRPYAGVFLNESYFVPAKMADTQRALKGAVEKKFNPAGCDTIKSIVDHEMGHEIDRLINASGDTLLNRLFKKYHTADGDKMSDVLSRYAATNVAEMIAEAYAECENNPKPRPFARAVMRRIKTLYKRKYGGVQK